MQETERRSPERLWLMRHGESAGNVARDAAYAARQVWIDIAERDADVTLSALGERQAAATGQWFGRLPENERPTVVLTSPYVRAHQTAQIVAQNAGLNLDDVTFVVDERLREREFGILDRLTKLGIEKTYPDQAELRKRVGKFYYRPPGGESWCDVILRLRSVADSLAREYSGERVLIACHSVVILCFRYLLEKFDEKTILQIDKQEEVANCSLTTYRFETGQGHAREWKPILETYNFVAPVEEGGQPVTAEPDVQTAPRG
jgi:2,3-bisphosphoglycerate-dependent phosphoglycerate mutase